MNRKLFITVIAGFIIVGAVLLIWLIPSGEKHGDGLSVPEDVEEIDLLFGINYTDLVMEEGTINSGETISAIFARYGVGASMVDRTAHAADSVFSLRNIRAGNKYTAFFTADSLERLVHFVYEQNTTDYLIISFEGDSIYVRKEHKDIKVDRKKASTTINSSLWNSMVEAGMTPALAMDLSDIYAWTIDFFGLQKGDHFTVVYDERYVDSTSIGAGRIWGAIFNHGGKDYYAIPFQIDEKISYWDENGNSLRKNLLKAPLQYSRISSKFSNSRLHPVLKVRRPHHGVDYAAPAGTPVHAVADGVVTFKGWDSKGGGNTLKIKHAGDLASGYLHLRGFAKDIAVGTRVSQGDLIGYVGSTGTSTGPHLDFRIWKNGTPIDPLKIPSEPAEPIPDSLRREFEFVKERIIAELEDNLAYSLRIFRLDSLQIPFTFRPTLMIKDTVSNEPAAGENS